MALHKRDQFTTDEQEVAAIAKALGHPARIAILRLLAARQSCVCGDIVQELPLSQSTVSQHLKELKAVGLVQGEIDGPRVCYCLAPSGWVKARRLLNDLLTQIPVAAPACAR
ncbi:MAG: winged helix-turn-helix transcriptional regulator [Hymenobacteraceae bacterium]|nr:winged helix-turn-helix transcriptional regulator [Hymenobacteraceae bacterium]